MTQNKKTFYITTTLPYVNGDPHIGFALEIIRADVIARYKKALGYDVFFNTGTDEHGLKLYEAAKEKVVDIMDYLDEVSAKYRNILTELDISEDIHFIRTTDEHHKKSAQALWNRVFENGYIYKKNYQTKYCVGCEENKTDSELEEGKCPLHPNRQIELIDEENYFFKLSALQDDLFTLFESNPEIVVPETRLNEMRGFVKRGLEDFSISRLKSKMPWGIDVPGDENQVMYVWFDALTNYISTLGWPENEGDELGDFNKYWVNGTPVQYCGKDNTRFQSITWQSMLLAAGLPTTHKIIINGWITGEGGVKMSKSLGNVINPSDICSEFSADALRFFVTKELQPFEDSPFTVSKFKEIYNAHLANGIGNLVSRMMKMATSYEAKLSEDEIMAVRESVDILNGREDKNIEAFRLDLYVQDIFDEFTKLDQFIQKEAPFKKFKIDPEAAKKDLIYLQEQLLAGAYKLSIIMPKTSEVIVDCIVNHKMPEAPLFLRKD
ncbi:MAG: methionine--tRNA ligase [bacterium]